MKMQLSKSTLDLLKNFADINENLLVKEGNKLTTISVQKNVLAEATVEETFDKEFAIYDLNGFLSVLGIFENPELILGDDYATISSGRSSTKFWYADPSLVVSPSKSIVMPDAEVEFTLTKQQLADILKASSVMQLPDIALKSDGQTVSLVATDKKNTTSNEYVTEVADGTGDIYNFFFKKENLKLIPGDYSVKVTSKNISEFTNQATDLKYFIALEADSKYEG
jgi:hypothetical protein